MKKIISLCVYFLIIYSASSQNKLLISYICSSNYFDFISDKTGKNYEPPLTVPAIGVSISVTHVSCWGQNTGKIVFSNPSGGSGIYEYSVDDGATWDARTEYLNLIAKSYSLWIRDKNNISDKTNFLVIISQPLKLIGQATIINPVLCTGIGATVQLDAIGGTGIYTYTFNQINNSTGIFTNIPSGNFNWTISDNAGCSDNGILIVNSPANELKAEVESQTPTCTGISNGTATILASGGSPGYQYSLNQTNWTNNRVITGLAEGVHIIFVKDVTSTCIIQIQVQINKYPEINLVTNPVYVCGQTTANLTNLSVTSGSEAGLNYTYWIDNQATIPLNNYTVVTPGIYYIKGTSDNNCTSIKSVNVLSIPVPQFVSINPNCSGGLLNSVAINATISEGSIEYSSNNGNTYQSGNTFSGLNTGITYDLAIRKTGTTCIALQSYIPVCNCPSVIGNSIASSQTICAENFPGSFTGGIPNITPISDFSYQWQYKTGNNSYSNLSTSGTNADFQAVALSNTTYFRRLVKINGCPDNSSNEIVVTVNPKPIITGIVSNCTGVTLNSVAINATVNDGIIEYSSNNGNNFQANNSFTGLISGTPYDFVARVTTTNCFSVQNYTPNCNCTVISENIISSSQSICSGQTPGKLTGNIPNIQNPATISYQWQSRTGNNPYSDIIQNGLNFDYQSGNLTSTTDFRRIIKFQGCPDDISNIITVTVNQNITPTFIQIPDVCFGNTIFPLPTISTNGISGTWTPALNNTSTTSYTFTPNPGQCASVSTMQIKIKPNFNISENKTICFGQNYFGFSTSGTFTRNLVSVSGCDSIVTTQLTVKPKIETTEILSFCEGYNYLGWTTSGTYIRNLQAISGCDSIVKSVLTFFPSYNITEFKTICIGQNYNGWNTSGKYIRSLYTKSGCDSIVTTFLTVESTKNVTETQSICSGQNYNGWTTSGTYIRNLQAKSGCDSIVTTILTVSQAKYVTEIKFICSGQNYNGWTTSGTYIRNLQVKSGCDSIVTTVLTVNPTKNITEIKTICSGQNYNGWTTSGTYIRTLQTKSGCDSIVTTALTVNQTKNITEIKSICSGQNYNGWTTSGTYVRTLQAISGCDSIVTTALTVNQIKNITETKSICSGQNYNGWNTSGTYVRTLQAKSGCDSVVTSVLTVNQTKNITETKSICSGQNYNGWTTSGTYIRNLQAKSGCDSIVTTVLTVSQNKNVTEIKSICSGQSYNGWTTSGTYIRNLQAKSGCDSIVTTVLTVNQTKNMTETKSICLGQNYNGWTTSGTYIRNLQAKSGCDSIVTTGLTVNQNKNISEIKSICFGQNYNGWTTSGTYIRNLQAKSGCDSIVTTILTVNQTKNVTETRSICSGQNYNGWTTSGTYIRNLQTKSGCDSIVTTVLTVNQNKNVTEIKSICSGQNYNGWTTSGTYIRNLQTKSGCDSIIITNLTINLSKNTIENKSICFGQNYNGWSLAGTYSRILKSISGCDSIISTILKVNPVYNQMENVSICEGQKYFGWTNSGIYKRNYLTKTGCDSIITTNLKVLQSVMVTENKTICFGQSYNGWINTGIYQRKLQSSTGCDSIVTTILKVKPKIEVTEILSFCYGLNYLGWTNSGTYVRTLQTNNGCDSIVTTILSFYPPVLQPKIIVKKDTLKSSDSYSYYQWHNELGKIQGANSNSYHITKSGKYYLEVTDVNGCKNKSEPVNAVWSETKVLKQKELSYVIYPNPNTGKFTFKLNSSFTEDITLKLYNQTGNLLGLRLIKSGQTIPSEFFDMSGLSKGIYVLLISSGHIYKSEKILIQ